MIVNTKFILRLSNYINWKDKKGIERIDILNLIITENIINSLNSIYTFIFRFIAENTLVKFLRFPCDFILFSLKLLFLIKKNILGRYLQLSQYHTVKKFHSRIWNGFQLLLKKYPRVKWHTLIQNHVPYKYIKKIKS